MRHWPAVEPSVRPHCPLASVRTAASELVQVSRMQSAFFIHVRPVSVSYTVPSLLSMKRGDGKCTPFCRLASSAVPKVAPPPPPVLAKNAPVASSLMAPAPPDLTAHRALLEVALTL